MNQKQKQTQQHSLKLEQQVTDDLQAVYEKAQRDVLDKIDALLARSDANTPTVIYQVEHQLALAGQITGILNMLQGEQFNTISEYLNQCYVEGYTGALYDIHGQGFPILTAPDPQQVLQAVQLDSKLSKGLYASLGEDVTEMKKKVRATISRGISTGMGYKQMSDLILADSNVGFNNAIRIVRTEGHRIQVQSAMDACHAAKAQGCDVVKQWDATLDKRTRESHQKVDGQIRELDEPFDNGLMFPGDPNGKAAEVINCRCALLQRAKWALDEDELETLKQRAEFYGLDKTKDFDDFQNKWLKNVQQTAPAKPKKEILTKKKLEQKLADGQVQMDDLDQQFKALTGGYSWDDIVDKYGSLDAFKGKVPAAKLKAAEDIADQIKALKADMDNWDDLLDKKNVQSELKKLKKDQILLKDQMDTFDTTRAYHNIWKDDVTILDYGAKQGGIPGKRSYFQGKLAMATDPDEIAKWQGLLDDLDDFEVQGSAYYKLQLEHDAKVRAWEQLKKSGTLKVDTSANAAYTQERKDAALWFDQKHGGFSAADKYFDPPSKKIHKGATSKERDGFYTYTQGSGGHNRPLAGFRKPWTKNGTGWEKQYYVGPKKVWIDFEGKGEQIRGLTTLIEKSTYADDIWLQSGQEFQTLDGFLGLPYGTVSSMSDADLQQYVGRRNVVYNFFSTAVNEGGGSMFNRKPMKINFYAPKGSQMLYASDVGAFGKGENEMILQRGGTYEISKIYWGNDATDGNRRKLFVDMEIHPEEGYDTFQQDPNEWTGSKENYRD